MIPRRIERRLKEAARKYPVVAIVGPRQSGKTTLAKSVFPRLPYATLENPDARAFALEDPKRFLSQFKGGAILDEVQRAPDLLSYIQTIVDEQRKSGLFILTGSQHFGLVEKITQSLAGRVSIQKLLPFSIEELSDAKRLAPTLNEVIFTGGYPRIFDKRLSPTDWLGNYVETYLERDVRHIKNLGDLSTFHRFLRMIAYRCGQLVNFSSIASDCGITHNTAKAWLSILEASYLVHLMPPHYRNFDKRLKKSSKLYFYDSGLACFLLGITRPEELLAHSMRGALFESFVISELIKRRFNEGLLFELYFWQDKLGKEIDCLIEKGSRLIPVEIKSGITVAGDYFDNIAYWERLAKISPGRSYLIYAGEGIQERKNGKVLGWRDLGRLPL